MKLLSLTFSHHAIANARSFPTPLTYANASGIPAAAMSSTAVHPPAPPMLFGQQSPSSPSFSSPQSPTESQYRPAPAMASSSPPSPQAAEDIDMSMSTTLPPSGQRHDREDAIMQEGLTNGLQPDPSNTQTQNQANNVAIEVAAVAADEDAMDTTSDDAQAIVLPNGSAEPREAAITPSSPNDTSQGVANGNENSAVSDSHTVSSTLRKLSFE